MLLSLRVRNIVLIDDVALELSPGLTVITGETGAGKSALVGAFSTLLGLRGGRELIRAGAAAGEVEAVFRAPGQPEVARLLEESGLEAGEELVLRRVLSADGRSRAFVNSSQVPLRLLQELSELLVSVTSQHEHYRLLDARSHVDYLDRFGGLGGEAGQYRAVFLRLKAASAELERLARLQEERTQRLELIGFQAREIDEVAPRPGELEELEARHRVLRNVEELKRLAHEAWGALYEEEDSLFARAGALAQRLHRGAPLDTQGLSPMAARADGLREEARELAGDLKRYFDSLEVDPEEQARVAERLDRLNTLCFKYGRTLEDVLQHRERIGREADSLGGEDRARERLAGERAALEAEAGERSAALGARRQAVAGGLEAGVMQTLKRLQMAGVGFRVEMRPCEPHEGGGEQVAFLVETNPGEGYKPLGAIVSGGELSRILLALERTLLDAEGVPVHLFDEIDTGISQAVAVKVGEMLKELAGRAQVVVITHHPHIARFGEHHLVVDKLEQDGRAVTRVTPLKGRARVAELARMLGGEGAGLPVYEQAELLLR